MKEFCSNCQLTLDETQLYLHRGSYVGTYQCSTCHDIAREVVPLHAKDHLILKIGCINSDCHKTATRVSLIHVSCPKLVEKDN